MASRIGLSRIIEWFRTGDLEETHYVFHRAAEILKQRVEQESKTQQPKEILGKRGRKPRRTKVQITADNAADSNNQAAAAATE